MDFFFRVYPRRNHGVRKLDNRHEADVRLILAARSLRQMPMSQLSRKIRRPRSFTRDTSLRIISYVIVRYVGSSRDRRIRFNSATWIWLRAEINLSGKSELSGRPSRYSQEMCEKIAASRDASGSFGRGDAVAKSPFLLAQAFCKCDSRFRREESRAA